MEKVRIGIFNIQPPHLYFGGVERRILELSRRLIGKADFTVYCGTKRGFRRSTLHGGVSLHPIFCTDIYFPLDSCFFNYSLAMRAKFIKCDVYESHTISGYGFLRSKRSGPLIETIHGVLADEYVQTIAGGSFPTLRLKTSKLFMRRLADIERALAAEADLIVTVSQYSSEKIVREYSVDREKIRIVPSGVDFERFKPLSRTMRETVKKCMNVEGAKCILYVGSLIPRKGLNYLLEATAKIVGEVDEAVLVIAGEGPMKGYLRRFVEKKKLNRYVRFLGEVGDEALPKIYNCADVFVSPSLQEGQGLTLLEAQASGVPVVAFKVGAVPETVIDRETGILVDVDADELASAVLWLLRDEEMRIRMGKRGVENVKKNFSWEKCADEMLRVYYEAASFYR